MGPCADGDATARELATRAVNASPGWFRALFALRQWAARLVGLKTKGGAAENGLNLLGDQPVLEDRPERFAIGVGDRHLDFVITVEKAPGEVAFGTDIWFNGWTGRAYLALVLPIHNLILRRYARALGPGASR